MEYEEILKLLENAKGRSEHVIAINLGIRGFTPFCGRETPLDVATYITKIYSKIIKNYFNNALFYKLTGDGLIIIIPFAEKKLREISNVTVDTCLKLLKDFGALCKDEPMINFPIPDKIGIGLTRGSACCIISKDGEKILDYSGRILNLASRLMDLARPSGIVFDGSFGISLLSDTTRKSFSEDTVYIRSVAEETPIKIHYTEKHTLIPDAYHHPLKEPKWEIQTYEYKLKDFKKFVGEPFSPTLKKKPLDANKIRVRLTYNSPKVAEMIDYHDFFINGKEISYSDKGFIREVEIDVKAILPKLEDGLTDDTKIRIDVIYPIK